MKTRDVVIAVISTILIISVIGCVYYMYNYNAQPSTTKPTYAPTIDPRTNLTNVVKGTIEKFETPTRRPATAEEIKNFPTSDPPQDITKTVLPEFFKLIALVKKITGKEKILLCKDIPSKIMSHDDKVYGDSVNKLSSMDIIRENIKYITKGAYKVAVENMNFYDITALYFQEVKVIMGDHPFPITSGYDSSGQLSTVIIYDGKMKTNMALGQFSKIFLAEMESITIPADSHFGNDPDLISFVGKMVPFYKSFVPTLASMDQSMVKFDVLLFGKLMACMYLLGMIKSSSITFVCTSLNKEILTLYV
jgi:hypothetical protein